VLPASGAARAGAGMSAAPAMMRQKAKKRPPISTGPEPICLWKTTTPPKIAARLAATEVSAMTSTPLADLEAAGRGVSGSPDAQPL
jgi:hypothetical protein